MTVNGTNGVNGTPKTGIKVIVVGAGFGGLAAAIECHRQGHSVEIYEAFPALKSLGDVITFGTNAGRIFARWGNGIVTEKFKPLCHDSFSSGHGFNIRKWDTGEVVWNQSGRPWDPTAPFFSGHRGELHEVVFEYARELGIPLRLGSRIKRYFEDEEGAGIFLEDGEKVTGDVVIAADGVKSTAREIVLGHADKPKSSGYAIWRTWFPATEMRADPLTAPFCASGDTLNGWIGADIHFLFSTLNGGRDCCWGLTHKDAHDIDESWQFPGKKSEVLAAVKGWDPMVRRIIEKTPEERLVDWKLVYRDPLPTWVSPRGRILLLGDSAHPFLPTSAQGAAQAVEDGASVAVCLRRGGMGRVPEAVRTHERIRYERVKKVQKTGETTRDMWHKVDWAEVKKDPSSVQIPLQDWIMEHDAEMHAEEVYDGVAAEVAKSGVAE